MAQLPLSQVYTSSLSQDPHFSEAVQDFLTVFTDEELAAEPFLKPYIAEQLARWGRWTARGRASAVCFEAACVGSLRFLQKRGLTPTKLTAKADATLARVLAGMVIDAVEPLAMEQGAAVREKAIGIVADEFLARAATPKLADSAKKRMKRRQSQYRSSDPKPEDTVSQGLNTPPQQYSQLQRMPPNVLNSPRMGFRAAEPNARKNSLGRGNIPPGSVPASQSLSRSPSGKSGGAEARARARARKGNPSQSINNPTQQLMSQSSGLPYHQNSGQTPFQYPQQHPQIYSGSVPKGFPPGSYPRRPHPGPHGSRMRNHSTDSIPHTLDQFNPASLGPNMMSPHVQQLNHAPPFHSGPPGQFMNPSMHGQPPIGMNYQRRPSEQPSEFWRQRSASGSSIDYPERYYRRPSQDKEYKLRPAEEHRPRRPSEETRRPDRSEEFIRTTDDYSGRSMDDGRYYRRPSVDKSQPAFSKPLGHSNENPSAFTDSRRPSIETTGSSESRYPNSNGSGYRMVDSLDRITVGGMIVGSRKTSLDIEQSKQMLDAKKGDKGAGGLSELLQSVLDECEDYMDNLDRS